MAVVAVSVAASDVAPAEDEPEDDESEEDESDEDASLLASAALLVVVDELDDDVSSVSVVVDVSSVFWDDDGVNTCETDETEDIDICSLSLRPD